MIDLTNVSGISTQKTLAPYFGGKGRLADVMYQHYPIHKHRVYVFGGLAGDLLNQKPPSNIEVFNDYEKNIYALFRLFLNKERFQDFVEFTKHRIHSRSLLQEATMILKSPDTSLEDRGKYFYYILRHSHTGGHFNSPSFGIPSKGDKNPLVIMMPISEQKTLRFIFNRIRNKTSIECDDFGKIIKRFDKPDTLFVCDPPYVNQEKNYLGDFKKADHSRLSSILNDIEGKAIITYADNPLVQELYQNWFQVKIRYKHSVGNAASRSEKEKVYDELLLMNYDYTKDRNKLQNRLVNFLGNKDNGKK